MTGLLQVILVGVQGDATASMSVYNATTCGSYRSYVQPILAIYSQNHVGRGEYSIDTVASGLASIQYALTLSITAV